MRSFRLTLWLFAAMIAQRPLWAVEHEMIDGRRAVAHEVLVKFRTATSARTSSRLMQQHAVSEARELGRSGFTRMRAPGKSAAQLVKEFAADPDVVYAEPNYIVEASATPNDPYFSYLWGLSNSGQTGGLPHADIDAVDAWSYTTGSRANVVGVVDSGVDYTHPDLSANIWSAPSSFTVTFGTNDSITCPAGSHGYDAITNSCTPTDQNGHGTHVSGTIGASGNNGAGVTGVNWTASIMGLRFLDANGQGNVGNAIRAIEFAIQTKAKFGTAANVRVLNNSWGGSGYSQALLDEINKANAAGMLFVVAAGNDGANLDTRPSYPASYTAPNLISVAATDASDLLASYSNYSVTYTHLGAPGSAITSTMPNSQYGTGSGTSMATPHVSGVAALVLSACALDTAGLKTTLLSNVDAIPSLVGKTATGGRLNAYRAVRACSSGQPVAGFTLSATPSALTIAAGKTTTTAVKVTASGGFTGNVSLSVTGLPTGVTGAFAPATVAAGGTSTLTLTAASTAAAATASFTVKGVSGTLSNSTLATVTVQPPPGFKVALTSSALSLAPGSSVTTSVQVAAVGGFTGNVALTLTGLPSGVTATFTPSTVAAGTASTLKLTAATNAVASTSTLTIKGTSGTLTATANASLAVKTAAGFTLSVTPPSITLKRGAIATYTISVAGTGGFSGTISIRISGLPTNTITTFSTGSTPSQLVMKVQTLANTPLGTYTPTVTATSGTLTQTAAVTLIVAK